MTIRGNSVEKEPLLLLVHRIPYPPNKGDKIRSFHLLKYLSQYYDVYLGAFIDDPEDKKHIAKVSAYCRETCLIEIHPGKRKLHSLKGFLTNHPLSIPYYKLTRMQNWVDKIIASKSIKKHLVYSSPMAQYLKKLKNDHIKIIDFVDVDSEKWRQYSDKHSGLMKFIYAREGKKLLEFEKQIAADFDCSLFVSKNEAALFKKLAPDFSHKVYHYSNGVDTTYFSPDVKLDNPYLQHGEQARIMVFTGAMDYWANQEAVTWFAEHIFPGIKQKVDNVYFYIVGSNPSEKIKQLSRENGIKVTGRVDDIRPYIAYASLVTAPLRIARGIQNKVLEAMAMAKPVVATHAAMDGIEKIDHGSSAYTSDSETEMIDICQKILTEGDYNQLGAKGRELVLNHFSWDSHLSGLSNYLKKQ